MVDIVTPAEAVLEDLGPLYDGGGERWWRVTVRTAPYWPGPKNRRTYTVRAWHETHAARQGLARFTQDIDGHRPIEIDINCL